MEVKRSAPIRTSDLLADPGVISARLGVAIAETFERDHASTPFDPALATCVVRNKDLVVTQRSGEGGPLIARLSMDVPQCAALTAFIEAKVQGANVQGAKVEAAKVEGATPTPPSAVVLERPQFDAAKSTLGLGATLVEESLRSIESEGERRREAVAAHSALAACAAIIGDTVEAERHLALFRAEGEALFQEGDYEAEDVTAALAGIGSLLQAANLTGSYEGFFDTVTRILPHAISVTEELSIEISPNISQAILGALKNNQGAIINSLFERLGCPFLQLGITHQCIGEMIRTGDREVWKPLRQLCEDVVKRCRVINDGQTALSGFDGKVTKALLNVSKGSFDLVDKNLLPLSPEARQVPQTAWLFGYRLGNELLVEPETGDALLVKQLPMYVQEMSNEHERGVALFQIGCGVIAVTQGREGERVTSLLEAIRECAGNTEFDLRFSKVLTAIHSVTSFNRGAAAIDPEGDTGGAQFHAILGDALAHPSEGHTLLLALVLEAESTLLISDPFSRSIIREEVAALLASERCGAEFDEVRGLVADSLYRDGSLNMALECRPCGDFAGPSGFVWKIRSTALRHKNDRQKLGDALGDTEAVIEDWRTVPANIMASGEPTVADTRRWVLAIEELTAHGLWATSARFLTVIHEIRDALPHMSIALPYESFLDGLMRLPRSKRTS